LSDFVGCEPKAVLFREADALLDDTDDDVPFLVVQPRSLAST
jgi:hypothetical protein